MALQKDFYYSEDHEWINVAPDEAVGTTVRVGITNVAADRLGEIVFAELPQVGDTVTAVNEDIDGAYEAINNDPYGAGWLFEVEVEAVGELMTADEYAAENGVEG